MLCAAHLGEAWSAHIENREELPPVVDVLRRLVLKEKAAKAKWWEVYTN